ncbi:arginine--tRNA ligase [Dongia deserti]|uniref:arginine--tRNA ligase n=1 Tax=Dongia deserti TaxID=2268030 RepID=UPI000E651F3E|nr:arginine--tRNA ligase [Dongia deserti]
MSSLSGALTEVVARVFDELGLPAEYGRVTISNRPDLGQFQCNGALAAAKAAKQNPRAIAEQVMAKLQVMPQLRDTSLAGPGFINLSVTDERLAEHANWMAGDERLAVTRKRPEMVVLDYGGANIAKAMHVGHLRAAIIGDSLRRIFSFAGDNTVGDVHMGDWGLQMGMLISELEIRRPDLPYFDPNFKGPYPNASPVTVTELEEIYPTASAACKADPARNERARVATAELQQGRPGYRALWQHFFDISVEVLKRDYGALGVHFDLWKGEAHVDPLIGPMVEKMKAMGLAEVDQGALIVRVARPDDKKEIPPLILVKRDGAAMYSTTDLATIVDRVNEQNPDLILYIVDQRQHLHFEQVFRAAIMASLNGKAKMEHLGFGTMNGPDGKPFKTREGGVMKLQDLIAMMTGAALDRLKEQGLATDYDEAERKDIAKKVGLAALKFADLSNHRIANYVFDPDRFVRFEGKTGPYLLYAAVRIKSILRKADAQGDRPGTILPPEPGERDLVLALGALPDAIQAAYDERAPNRIADYAYGLAQTFSTYYNQFHILSEQNDALRRSRLGLAALTLRALELSLSLLGIEVPERM